MVVNIAFEIRVIQKFIRKEKQSRYISFVSSKKNRKKFIRELPHLRDLQWNLIGEVKSFEPAMISNNDSVQLCYVISEDNSVDGHTIDMSEVMALSNSGNAFILVFGEAEQVYYEGEPPFNRYFSKKL
jgi:hypothetical protein